MGEATAPGQYRTAPLAKDAWTLGVVQSRIHPAADQAELDDNLAHMLHLIDNAYHYGAGPDLLFFHEFPISGWDTWTREEALERCITLDGPEVAAIAERARKYRAHIAFGAYVKDPDWPGHVLSMTNLVGPDGDLLASHWKARNVRGLFPGFELFTTTVYDVLDEYIERYGADAVLPVAHTSLGNISLTSTQLEPELMRALAIKGTEVFLRTASGSFTEVDVASTALHNRVYVAIANNALLLRKGPYFEDTGAGGSAIFGPDGKAIVRAEGKHETLLTARIPIAEFRQRHLPPDIQWDLYRDVFDGYVSRFPPNLFSETRPATLGETADFVSGRSRWR